MKKKYINIVSFILLILSAGIIHIIAKTNDVILKSNTVILFLYTVAILLWQRKTRRIILNKEVSKYLQYIAYLLIAYLGIRTIKYEILPKNHYLQRYFWYSYYIFIFMISIFILFSVLHIGKGEKEKIDKKWKLLYIPVFFLSLIFMSNDYHQLVFAFPQGLDQWSDVSNEYGIMFYIMLPLMLSIVLLTFVYTFKKCFHMENKNYIWTTFLFIFLWSLYTYLYITKQGGWFYWFRTAFKSPEFNTIMIILFIESLIFSRLIPSNHNYENFIKLSTLKIGMVDLEGKFYNINNNIHINPQIIAFAECNPIAIDENTLLESAKIQGGRSYWLRDISQINKLKKELLDLGKQITEENELLIAENQMKKEQIAVQQQLEIYELIDCKLKDKVSRLGNILDNIPQEEDAFEQVMKKVAFVNVYIKRYSNLILLSKEKTFIPLLELGLAFRESLEYLKLSGITTSLISDEQGWIQKEIALRFYEVFQDIVECYFSDIQFLTVSLLQKK